MKRGNLFAQQEVFGELNDSVFSHDFQYVLPSKTDIDRAMSIAIETHRNALFINIGQRKSFLIQLIEELNDAKSALRKAYILESNLSSERFDAEFNRVIIQIQQFVNFLSQDKVSNGFVSLQEDSQVDHMTFRKVGVPLGPIVVFGASNFPLAYATVGGDVVSALAAGCPVIVKGHPFHPETSYLSARCIQLAAEKSKLPTGIFAHFNTVDHEVGVYLVQHDHTHGVAFTGSYLAGKSIMDLASKRERPIPVFAEMGSLNPVILLPETLHENLKTIAKQLAHAVYTDAGQFCTKPGLIFVPEAIMQHFLREFTCFANELPAYNMLHPILEAKFQEKIKANLLRFDFEDFGMDRGVFCISLNDLLSQNQMLEELFGPVTCLVSFEQIEEIEQYILLYDGFLTSSVYGTKHEINCNEFLLNQLILRSGRLIFNHVPTGVRVVPAMQHGGPYPASSTPHFTAVGVDSIMRFLRPVTLQFDIHEDSFYAGF